MTTGNRPRIDLPMNAIADLCCRWHIVKMSLFGSVMRDDFRPDSDIDVLITFAPGTYWPWGGLFDIAQELSALLGRHVEVMTHRAVDESTNHIFRESVHASLETIYAA